MESWILTLVIFSPLAGAAWLIGGDRSDGRATRNRALISSTVTAVLALIALAMFFGAD